MIRFLQVGKRLGAEWALARFSLDVKPGELAWLEGPPGSGKSLVVKLALGELLATTGSVEVGGANPAKLRGGERRAWRRGLAVVRDDDASLVLPALEWTALAPWCAGRPWPAALSWGRDVLERHALLPLAQRAFRALSPRQRLAVTLARALARKPHALLVDWAGWTDAPLPGALADELAAYVAEGGTALVAGSPGTGADGWGGRRVTFASVNEQVPA